MAYLFENYPPSDALLEVYGSFSAYNLRSPSEKQMRVASLRGQTIEGSRDSKEAFANDKLDLCHAT